MAKIGYIVTDMGTGGAYCEDCGENLDHGQPTKYQIPENCPNCKAILECGGGTHINRGGSDY